jgi:hypothetical protein
MIPTLSGRHHTCWNDEKDSKALVIATLRDNGTHFKLMEGRKNPLTTQKATSCKRMAQEGIKTKIVSEGNFQIRLNEMAG